MKSMHDALKYMNADKCILYLFRTKKHIIMLQLLRYLHKFFSNINRIVLHAVCMSQWHTLFDLGLESFNSSFLPIFKHFYRLVIDYRSDRLVI